MYTDGYLCIARINRRLRMYSGFLQYWYFFPISLQSLIGILFKEMMHSVTYFEVSCLILSATMTVNIVFDNPLRNDNSTISSIP